MITVTCFEGQTVAVLGLGGSGIVAARALKAGGARVIVHDDDKDRIALAVQEGFERTDLQHADWTGLSALILAPGVPLTHPAPHWSVLRAQEHGVEIIGDVELFFRQRSLLAPEVPVVAITGTNGKSTTTALAAHVFGEAGFEVHMGGNIGVPVLDLDEPRQDGNQIYVLELSSYQIDLTPTLKPTIGIHLNLSPDHLDRHGSMDRYAAIKERLIQEATDFVVVGVDDDLSQSIATRAGEHRGADHVAEISVLPLNYDGDLKADFCALGSELFLSDVGHSLVDLKDAPTLRGQHNAQNALAVLASALWLGVPSETIQTGFETFPGLAHRMELVARKGTVLFVNDSKATNADAAAHALASFESIYWILGGKAKSGGIASLTEYFPKIRHFFLIGEASNTFSETLSAVPDAQVTQSGTLDQAVLDAVAATEARAADEECVVLLSPACASFDQFRNFELRGEAFKVAVMRVEGVEPF